MLFFLFFVHSFWLIHIIRRIFEHTYIWQVKEYRLDRMKAYIKDVGIFSLRSYPTLLALLFFTFSIFLVRSPQVTYVYLILLIGFGYYIYQSLSTVTYILNHKLIRPKKSVRNALIIGAVVMLTLMPLASSVLYYASFVQGTPEISSTVEPVAISDIFPKRDTGGVLYIPPETITIGKYFSYLFAFDLILPLLIGSMVALTSIFSRLMRKKKL